MKPFPAVLIVLLTVPTFSRSAAAEPAEPARFSITIDRAGCRFNLYLFMVIVVTSKYVFGILLATAGKKRSGGPRA